MADTPTGLAVKSLAAESVRSKLVDTGGTNEAAISAAGRISVDGSGVTQPVSGTVAVSSITTAVVPGTAATNLGKAEDAAHSTGDTGVFVLAVRNDAGTALAGTDGDYIPFSTDNTGALRVTGGSAGTQYVGDAAATSTPTGTMSVGLANSAAPTDVSANNDAVAMWMLRNGSPVVNLASGGTLLVGGNGTAATALRVTLASDSTGVVTLTGSLPAGTNNIGDVDVLTVPAPLSTTGNGTAATALRVTLASDSTGTTIVTQATASNLNAQVVGAAATDAAVSGNPVYMGGRAFAAAPTDMSADGDMVPAWHLRNGAAATVLTAAGALIGGDATNGLDVDVTRVIPGTTATALGKAEDAAHTTGDTGVFILAVRNDAGTALATTDGDYIPFSTDNTGALRVTGGSSGTQYVGDAAATSTPTGTVAMGLANAAAPTDVSANNDAVAQWMLRNGSAVVNLASGGTLLTIGQKTMANALSVSIASDQSNLPSNITQIGGATPSATVYLPGRLTDGTAYYSKTGQTAGTASYAQLSDQTNTASIIATINSLKVDASSIAGAVPSATNPLPVRITDGSAFYSAASSAPASPVVSTVTSSALGAGSSVDLDHTTIANGTTGQLMGVDVASTVPLKIEIQSVDGSSVATTRVVLFATNYSGVQWRSPYKTFLTRAGAAANTKFRTKVTNKDASTAADVYATAYFDVV